ncbi:MAG: helix-turn-helix transcriptional regulator [Lachnospiraceae bacterium]|nr:helix-turn-helix transcriptional regulator [Lachnospiraceae bacterium]
MSELFNRFAFQKNVKRLAKEHGLQLKELEQALGMPVSSLSRYWSVSKNNVKAPDPSISVIIKIANFFEVGIDDLIGRELNDDFDDMQGEVSIEQKDTKELAKRIQKLSSQLLERLQ